MKRILLLVALFSIVNHSFGQITITNTDMPVSGDTLRYSLCSPVGATINLGDSGAAHVWDYSALTPISQAVDTYKTAIAVNPLYLLISFTAYGYKVADTLPGVGSFLPVSIDHIYTFFQNSSSNYKAVAFAAQIAGVPTPINYTTDDKWYTFPLTYLNSDSNNYALNISLATLGSLKQVGYRKNRVDGYGTIVTPYYTTPQNCLRIRSEIHEIDSIGFGATTFGLPNNSVDYKWLINGQHYPALWVSARVVAGTETISTIRYRDAARNITVPNDVASTKQAYSILNAFPNPSSNGQYKLDVPAEWTNYTVEVFNLQSQLVYTGKNYTVDLSALPSGEYLARVTCGAASGLVKLTKN